MASNFKAAAVAADRQEGRVHGQTMQVKIDGLRPNYEVDGNYFLDGVEMATINWEAIGEELEKAGIAKADVYSYTDDFAKQVFQRELGKVLASRITLV